MSNTPRPTSPALSTKPRRASGRLAVIAVLVALFVFGSEVVLSSLRSRNLSVAFETNLRFTPTPLPVGTQPTATPTRNPDATATPIPQVVFLKAGDEILVRVTWDYRIGPRFQRVILGASANNGDRAVAQATAAIDCGAAILSCSGTTLIPLTYEIPDPNAASGSVGIPWPVGEYKVLVEQSAGGLKYTTIQEKLFRVQAQ